MGYWLLSIVFRLMVSRLCAPVICTLIYYVALIQRVFENMVIAASVNYDGALAGLR
jgi:hypothetical protein